MTMLCASPPSARASQKFAVPLLGLRGISDG